MSKPMHSIDSALIRGLFLFSAMVGATALSGCDAGYGIEGTVTHADPSLAGHVLVVNVYPESELGPDGLPELAEDEAAPRLALAKRVDGDESTFSWGKLGCDARVRVVAWVDVDDSEKLEEALPPGGSLDSDEASSDLASRIAVARPGPGDWRAVSIAFDFDQSITCDPGKATIALEVRPGE